MSGEDQNTKAELPAALNGRPKEAVEQTPTRAGTTSNVEREGAISRGSVNRKVILDWENYQPTADEMDTDWDRSPAHLLRPRALRAFGSLSHSDEVHQAANGNGHTLLTQRPTAIAVARRPTAAVLSQSDRTPFAFAGLALLLGYAWLLAGVDKILLGNFPAQLTQILAGTLRGATIPGFFAAFLRVIVLPNGATFGFMAEYAEALAGLGLIVAGMAILVAPPLERRMPPPVAQWIAPICQLLVMLGVLAAVGTVLLGGIYYLLDGAPSQVFMPSVAFNGALDPGLQLALGSLLLLAIAALARMQRRSSLHQLATAPVRRDESNGRKQG
jgi:hypothetical protein